MIVDRTSTQWILGAAAGALVSTAIYGIYALLATNGPRGGSAVGLAFAFAGTAIIAFECLLSLRKKYPASPLGCLKTWLRGHVWLGLLSFLLILFHAGFRWGHGLAAVIMGMFLLITLSGIYGLALQNYIPHRLTELVGRETIYQQIPVIVSELRLDADERVEFVTADLGVEEGEAEAVKAGGVKQYFDPKQKASAAEKVEAEVKRRKTSPQIVAGEEAAQTLRQHYLQEMRPFLIERPLAFSRKLFGTPERVAAYFAYIRTLLPESTHQVLSDLEEICQERQQLLVQARLHRWLHGWLFLHVPLSFAFLLLTFVHAIWSLRY
jgi:hypothetical protein